MNDLISRQTAIGALTENKEMINTVLDSLTLDYNTRRNEEQRRGQINEDIETIKALPSAQPEREKGEWMFSPDGAEGVCTVCQYKIYGRPYQGHYLIVPCNFCPNCGADMRGDTNAVN